MKSDALADFAAICAQDRPLTSWLISDGKIGDEAPCLGIALALGLVPERRVVRPNMLFAALAPRGPIDPRDKPERTGSPLSPPFPDIAIASGRRAVPYLRHLKSATGGRTFTIFLKDPRIGCRAADAIWVQAHDALRGANVIVSLTAPHSLSLEKLAQTRGAPDPRVADLRSPRVAILLGGESRHHSFDQRDLDALEDIAASLSRDGANLMITPSRRTPSALTGRVSAAVARAGRGFVWNGEGENPYLSMLACADHVIVTADSTNMLGEAVATGKPVHIYEPAGGHKKITSLIDSLVAAGAARRWAGQLDSWPAARIDSTPEIAAWIACRFLDFRRRNMLHGFAGNGEVG